MSLQLEEIKPSLDNNFKRKSEVKSVARGWTKSIIFIDNSTSIPYEGSVKKLKDSNVTTIQPIISPPVPLTLDNQENKTPQSPETSRQAVNELRRLSGLTWEQLAEIFGVSRRSLHSWASGEPLAANNESKLSQLLATIKYIDRGSASENRNLIVFTSNNEGVPAFDLLTECQYQEVKNLIGPGNGYRKKITHSLSKEEKEARKPLPPDILANPLPDISYREIENQNLPG